MGLRKEISTVVGGLHFGGRRSALCRGFQEVDLCWRKRRQCIYQV